MSRRMILMTLTGLVLVTGLGAPALAGPTVEDRESVCLRLDPEGGREGFCVYVGLPGRP